jgi:hypothetical protein
MRRTTRAGFVAAGTAAAAGVALASRHGVGPALRASVGGPSANRVVSEFAAPVRGGWGEQWQPVIYGRTMNVENGAAQLVVPRGNARTARAQPMPVMLLDSCFADGEQLAAISVDDPTLRPGLLARASSPFRYAGVTLEHDRLVVANYFRSGRRIAGDGAAAAVVPGSTIFIRARTVGDMLYARAWPEGDREPGWQAAGRISTRRPGMPGVLVVHPTSLRRCMLVVHSHEAVSGERLLPTMPSCPVLISGIPARRTDGDLDIRLRAWSSWPCELVFEWSAHPDMRDPRRSPPIGLADAPFTALHTVVAAAGGSLHWRARLTSPSSGVESVTPVHHVRTPAPGPVTLLAASCGKIAGPRPNAAFRRLLESARRSPEALVYQGDLGYANNRWGAAYTPLPDYFYDRFMRFLADPQFVELRRQVPTGFTLDDHDYGPPNNADRTTVAPWAVTLWNRLHADPSPRGYFDFRIGDVHCLAIDGRRYCDPVNAEDGPRKTKLGWAQRAWLERTIEESDGRLFVVYSADIFGTRRDPRSGSVLRDCFVTGWPDEYRWAMALFMSVQLHGRRVIVLSGDAHSLRINNHPDPLRRHGARDMRIIEFICSGLRPRLWSGAEVDDRTVDRSRYVLGVPGAGLVEIAAPGAARRTVTLRAIDGRAGRPLDAWQPLVLPFSPR